MERDRFRRRSCRRSFLLYCALVATLMPLLVPSVACLAQEAKWIWSPAHDKERVPATACHFRKTVTLRGPQDAKVVVVADDMYELYVNARRVGTGQSTEKMVEYDVQRFLNRGKNIIAIKVTNLKGNTGAVAARVLIRDNNDEWRSYSTDASWKSNLQPLPLWNTALYNDGRWENAQEFGQLGETPPWDVREAAVAENNEQPSTQRFKISDEFEIRELLNGEQTGSLIAMTFNEFGHILASREDGPLLLIHDADKDGVPEAVKPYCQIVKNCQGILALNGDVFVTANGPEGCALYRLTDKDRDGILEDAKAIIKFPGKMGEHGPHGVTLGHDGLLYVVVGNMSHYPEGLAESSPYWNWYEGDLVQPRFGDPSGHANGVKAPGGFVLRTDTDGHTVEIVAGGLRNAYDLSLNREGEIFVHDSDMESDIGTTWYRPTRLYHIAPGAEIGWRSGWASWPDYFVDGVPGILDTGRGSPTGAVFYQHFAFPPKYHDALFLADWSEGRILAVDVKRDGASYSASSEVFLEGKPLNVTDLEVGPDGGLYFCTGGRGTSGGIYRIRWKGEIPANVSNLGEGIGATIRQPQINSGWSRQQVAGSKQALEKEGKWEKQIAGVAKSVANPWYYRVRALQIMQLYGPAPSAELLIRISKDENEIVRAKAAELMGIHATDETHQRLIELLNDGDRAVRRRTCEALFRAAQAAPFDKLSQALSSDDRAEAYAARRLLEQLPPEEWRSQVLTSKNHRIFIQGGLALINSAPTSENAIAIANRMSEFMSDFISDRDFIDMLRMTQVAMHRSNTHEPQVSALAAKLADEFPSADAIMNRELVRLLAYLQVTSPMDRYLTYLGSDAADSEKLHLAMHMRYFDGTWTAGKRMEIIQFLEDAKQRQNVGQSYKGYVSNAQRDLAKGLSPTEGREVLAQGEKWPAAATGALYGLPQQLDDATLTTLIDLDHKLTESTDEAAPNLRLGVIAVLARSGEPKAFAYLRTAWENEPERRDKLAMGLAQKPENENWQYLVRSLPVLEGDSAIEVLTKLTGVDRKMEDPESLRQVILRGLHFGDDRAKFAVTLLEHWTGEKLLDEKASTTDMIKAWQKWYADTYPDKPPAVLPVSSSESKWQFDELLVHLSGEVGAKGNATKGATVFEKAQCAKCHRFGTRGETLGPDLTSLAKRFMKKEVLEAVVFPSQVISDQYAAKTIVTTSGRTYTGVVAEGSRGERIVLQSNGEKVVLQEANIDETLPSRKSIMPDNLLDSLTLEEISDLFAYLGVLHGQSVARRTTLEESDKK